MTDEKKTLIAKNLIKEAFKAQKLSYSPYSSFMVGAALLADKGIFTGCNIESAAFSPTICAERTALCKAISEGASGFKAIAIAGSKEGSSSNYCAPCGVCRQFMAEFCGNDFEIILARSEDDFVTYTLGELLPFAFSGNDIE